VTERLRLVSATANLDKAAEIAALIGGAIELLPRPRSVPDVIEDADTLEGNARLKANAVAAATGMPALADDTGLEVDALGGAPGVYSARYAGEHATYADNVARLLAALAGVPPQARTARFRAVMVVAWPGGKEIVADGVCEGTIADVPRGEGGFGYDPVFVPTDGDGRTFAEMTAAEKDEVSHRGRAVRAVRALLQGA
jgi:XTP/dITP diphosphohydrolase